MNNSIHLCQQLSSTGDSAVVGGVVCTLRREIKLSDRPRLVGHCCHWATKTQITFSRTFSQHVFMSLSTIPTKAGVLLAFLGDLCYRETLCFNTFLSLYGSHMVHIHK